MKRFHAHVSVTDLEQSIRFYSALFHADLVVCQLDYAKWMLDDPRINFAISSLGRQPRLDHLGLQDESTVELEFVQEGLTSAALPIAPQKHAACCYAQSDKYWTVDPQGIAWEAFHSLNTIPIFGDVQSIQLESVSTSCKSSELETTL